VIPKIKLGIRFLDHPVCQLSVGDNSPVAGAKDLECTTRHCRLSIVLLHRLILAPTDDFSVPAILLILALLWCISREYLDQYKN